MTTDIPTISTARLTLRPQAIDDFPALECEWFAHSFHFRVCLKNPIDECSLNGSPIGMHYETRGFIDDHDVIVFEEDGGRHKCEVSNARFLQNY